MYEGDYDRNGFRWIDCNNTENCLYAVERKSGNETLAAVFNFSDTEKSYSLCTENEDVSAEVLIHTDWYRFGGDSEEKNSVDLQNIVLPRFSGILFRL